MRLYGAQKLLQPLLPQGGDLTGMGLGDGGSGMWTAAPGGWVVALRRHQFPLLSQALLPRSSSGTSDPGQPKAETLKTLTLGSRAGLSRYLPI